MASTKTTAREVMVVNDSPGEECRIAILQDNHLEELYTERTDTATNVGNIYKGRVTNVEPAIQAAFVDYGQGQAGFLHISDLHPRYFPGAKRTERVGKKIPRRARPPIQEALKRGDEVLVQVLKEGIGTKGPTLTSYLSVPGRMLVMMPDMDRVGVSRKVEDPEQRRRMREILDSLDLPDGFGFILRTAAFGRTKTELNRDVAYLSRLWKVMEKRMKDVGAPCELYTESDLFVRTIRDVLRPSIEAIVVDSESAHDRAKSLLRVVAPRSAPKLTRYRDPVPIFHAFDIERQIELIHSREVPLQSGGKLVIDQTEALVAIDVNSGRSRRARDAETNAYETNREAVDEICRQLRLRDLGGLVINDLIDMYVPRHRRAIEDRFRAGLARDRAKTTMLRISEFGIVELTRQRMRPSLRKSHFMDCPSCRGRGEIKTPESVGADATRQAGYLLQFARVRRVEIVCSPRVASVLLSGKRRELVALEDSTGKKINVRVSDSIAVDRVDFYAYDERSADIDVSKLPSAKVPDVAELESAEKKAPVQAVEETAAASTRKKRRRRRRPKPADAGDLVRAADEIGVTAAAEPTKKKTKKKRRRKARREPAAPPAAEHPNGIRVHQLANELGVTSKELLAKAREEESAEVKSHMSSVSQRAAGLLRKFFGKHSPSKEKTAAAETAPKKPAAGPGPAEESKRPAAAATIGNGAPGREKEKKQTTPRRRRRRRKPAAAQPAAESKPPKTGAGGKGGDGKKRRSRRSPRGKELVEATAKPTPAASVAHNGEPAESGGPKETAGAKEPASTRAARSRLYRSRRSITPATRQSVEDETEE